jgi:hypothetical protein
MRSQDWLITDECRCKLCQRDDEYEYREASGTGTSADPRWVCAAEYKTPGSESAVSAPAVECSPARVTG